MFDWVLNATLQPLIITTPHMLVLPPHNTRCPFSTTNVPSSPRVQNKASQFANCEPFTENCKSKLLKKIAKTTFSWWFFFHSKLPYLLCPLVDQTRKEITQISSLIFHRTAAKNLVQRNISLITLSKGLVTHIYFLL